jgi:pheromone shutdown-related protein TraB
MMNDNVHVVNINEKEIILLGTAHVSEQSVLDVNECVEKYHPDVICIELDSERYLSIQDENKWKNTDIYQIIKQKKGMVLLANIILASYQRKIGQQLGISAGAEMNQAIKIAKQNNIKLELVDRNIKITFSRIWNKLRLIEKFKLIISLVMSLFDETEITKEELERLKQQDIITSALNEMGSEFQGVKEVLVDERDKYMSQKIKKADGKTILAVVGAAHIQGILNNIQLEIDLKSLDEVKEKKRKTKLLNYIVPAILIILILLSFKQDVQVGIKQIIIWFLTTGICSALGVLLALGSPLSMLTAFVAAPIGVLNPLLAGGWFAGLTEAYIRKPVVKDFENLYDDVATLKGFWTNKIAKILLVVALANVGSIVGTIIAGLNIIKNLI